MKKNLLLKAALVLLLSSVPVLAPHAALLHASQTESTTRPGGDRPSKSAASTHATGTPPAATAASTHATGTPSAATAASTPATGTPLVATAASAPATGTPPAASTHATGTPPVATAAVSPATGTPPAAPADVHSNEEPTPPPAVPDQPDAATIELDSIVVLASRVGAKSPVAFSQMDRSELQATSPIASLPMMLCLQPSVVSTNEGGTGLGYSKIRVRGSDPTRMNVSINGICYNDAESQQVFWVNLPSLSSMLNSAQLQRGAGPTSSGVGAFGSSLNLQTAVPENTPYTSVELSAGSFSTGILSVNAGTGRSAKGYSLDAACSVSSTEGYIRNAFARLHSFMLTAGRVTANSSAKLVCLYGKQRTGITWEGITAEQMAADRRYNPAGEFTAEDGTTCYYGNETDNYRQLNLQAIYTRLFSDNLQGSATLHYTRGSGYYENYKEDKDLRDYGLQSASPVVSDLVKRSQMRNDYYAANLNLRWQEGASTLRWGATYSIYDGDHFGNVVWTGLDAAPQSTCLLDPEAHYYDNSALKSDLSTFLKWEYTPFDEALYIFADLQYRGVDYSMNGLDDDVWTVLDSSWDYDFLNGNLGATLALGENGSLYASAALAHKEPCRSDIKDAIATESTVGPERLADFEAGYRFSSPRAAFAANLYCMEYKDQLVETGKISSSGYMVKSNIPKSYRRGVELTAKVSVSKKLQFEANSTFSTNKIVFENAATGVYKTDLMLSPRYVGGFSATCKPARRLTLVLSDKVVGSQYFDNISSPEHKLSAYSVASATAEYSFDKLKLSIFADNLLNSEYVADAWSYGESCGYFPQAPFSAMFKISYTVK